MRTKFASWKLSVFGAVNTWKPEIFLPCVILLCHVMNYPDCDVWYYIYIYSSSPLLCDCKNLDLCDPSKPYSWQYEHNKRNLATWYIVDNKIYVLSIFVRGNIYYIYVYPTYHQSCNRTWLMIMHQLHEVDKNKEFIFERFHWNLSDHHSVSRGPFQKHLQALKSKCS